MSRTILPTHWVADDFCDDDGNTYTGRYPWYPLSEEDLDCMDDAQLRALESRCRRRAKARGLRVHRRGDSYWFAPVGWKDQSELTGPMSLLGLAQHFLVDDDNVERVSR